MRRRIRIGIETLAAWSVVCAGAWAQGDDLDTIKAQIAERNAGIQTYSADTTATIDMGGLSFIIRGATRGKGAMQESTSLFEVFTEKMQFRSVTDAAGIHWNEVDAMGEKEVTKSDDAATASNAIGFGVGAMIGAEPVNPRNVLNSLAEHYDLVMLGQETLDGTEVYVMHGSLHADAAEESVKESRDADEPGPLDGFMDGLTNSIMHARAYIGTADGFPRKIVLLSDEGKPTLTQVFTNIKFNEPIDDSIFAYTPPDGVEVQDLDLMAATSTVSLGDRAPAFSVLGLDGKNVNLADYEGDVVLLEFWALWCTPCVEQLPEVIALYEKYHPQGFEIIGINMDGDRQKVESFLKEKPGIAWRQVFDGNAWDSEVALLYGVEELPLSVLVGKDGTILALDLHGAALDAAVAKALSAENPN